MTTSAHLPEPKWVMRRILTFGHSLAVLFLCAFAAGVFAVNAAHAALLTLTLALIIQNAALQIIYLVAPTAEYVSKIAELVRAARGGAQ